MSEEYYDHDSEVNPEATMPGDRNSDLGSGAFASANQGVQGRRAQQQRIAESRSRYRSALRERLAEAYKFRLELQAQAAENAGEVSMVYHAKTNTLSVISFSPLNYDSPAPLDRPEVVEPTPNSLFEANPIPDEAKLKQDPVESDERRLKIAEWIVWVLSAFIGAFIGFGLFKMAGFKPEQSGIMFAGALLIGIALYLGMKLSIYYLARNGAESSAISGRGLAMILCFALTIVIMIGELSLGGFVLKHYRDASTAGNGTSIVENLLIAAAIGTPVLLFSAITGWRSGNRADQSERAHAKRLEQFHELKERVRREHHESEEARRRAHDAAQTNAIATHEGRIEEHRNAQISELERQRKEFLAAREAAEKSRYAPEYRTALKLIGQIEALSVEIERLEEELGKAGIAEGYQISELNK